MNELRWILLGIGAVLLLLIYLFSRRTSDSDEDVLPAVQRRDPPLSMEIEPGLERDEGGYEAPDEDVGVVAETRFATSPEDTASVSVDTAGPDANETLQHPEPASGPDTAQEPENEAAPAVPEKVIALHLMPKSGQAFEGIEFIGAIQAEGLKLGRFDIFHRFPNPETATDKTPSSFSLANIIKPGTFNLQDLDRQTFKGASLFLVLPGPEDAVAAFADMLATGRRLAATLNGQLLDAQGTQLSRQSASHLREDIINYQHGLSATPVE